MKKQKKHTLESSINLLAEFSNRDLENSANRNIQNNTMTANNHNDDSHTFFDWDQWTFVDKKIFSN